MFAFGTMVVSLDEPETVRLPADVCPSPTVNAIDAVAVSSFVCLSVTSLIDGAVLAE